MKKYNVISGFDKITIRRKVGKNILEIDSNNPSKVYLQYGYTNGTGPWHSTSGIQYISGKYGFDTPSLWSKKTLNELDGMFDFSHKIFSQV